MVVILASALPHHMLCQEPSVVSEGFAACDYLLMHTLGTDSTEARFFVYYVLICVVSCVSYYLTAIPAVVAVLSKMRKHSFMLEQMADFDIRAAKCTLESDRRLVEKRIGELLARRKAAMTENGSAGLNTCLMMDQNMEPLDCFNAYVRGPLKQAVLEKIGDGMHVPYHLCLVASLPMALFSLVDLLSCSDVSCQMQARELDLSVQGYMGGLAGFWLLNDLMIYPIAQPILFRVLSHVCCIWERLSARIALGLLAAIILYTYIFLCSGLLLALSPFSVAAKFFLLLSDVDVRVALLVIGVPRPIWWQYERGVSTDALRIVVSSQTLGSSWLSALLLFILFLVCQLWASWISA